MKIASLVEKNPCIMGVLNTTPDSFSDGGALYHNDNLCLDTALQKAMLMVDQGADIIDIGGVSSRPGSKFVSADEEASLVVPVVEMLRKHSEVYISVDTSNIGVMSAAIDAGANMINDIYALRAEGALEMMTNNDVDICLMHMQGEPNSMQDNPQYQDVVQQIQEFFQERINACMKHGIKRTRLVLDVGFGFGKNLQHNLHLLKHLESFGKPLLAGVSRKSMLGLLTGRSVMERGIATEICHFLALQKGANILRTHDVVAARDTIKIWQAVA